MLSIPFGKHRHVPLNQVPRDYLEWFVREVKGCQPIKDAAIKILGDAFASTTLHSRPTPLSQVRGNSSEFVLPKGKHAGKVLAVLTDAELVAVRNAYNAKPQYHYIRDFCDVEIKRRGLRGKGTPHRKSKRAAHSIQGRFSYSGTRFRKMLDNGALTPWPDGFGSPERHERGGDAPFGTDSHSICELDAEYRAILGVY